MRLKPETIAAHQSRHQRERRYPPHTLAPDPHQSELELRPPRCPTARRLADVCPRCHGIHMTAGEAEHCRQANAQHEQF